MNEASVMTLDEIEDLAFRALTAAGTSEANARPLAKATAMTGQFFLAIDPAANSGDLFAGRPAALFREIRDQPGARLPGDGRKAAR